MKKGLITRWDRIDLIKKIFDKYDIEPILLQYGDRIKSSDLPVNSFFIKDYHHYLQLFFEKIKSNEVDFCISTVGYDNLVILDSFLKEYCDKIGIPFIGQSTECAVICNNKWLTKSILNSSNIKSLDSQLIHNNSELISFLKNATGIFICKPLYGWSGKGQFIINSENFGIDSTNSLKYPFIIEEFINAVEISIDIFTHDLHHIIYPPVYKGNTSIETKHALNRLRLFPYNWGRQIEDKIINCAKNIAVAVQSTGWLDIDMLLTENDLYVIEVNARFSGITRMISMVSELDPYEITLKAALGEQIDDMIIHRNNGISFEVPFYQKIPIIQNDQIYVYYSSSPHLMLGKITAKVETKKLPDDIKKLLIKGGIPEYIEEIQTYLSQLNIDSFNFQC